MKFVRFAIWNLGIRLCDTGVGGALNRFGLWFEHRTGRESRVYGCMLHDWIMPGGDVPEHWWDMFGWKEPAEQARPNGDEGWPW